MLAVLSTITEAGGNPLLEHQGRWTLVSHRRDTGKRKGIETRIGSEPQDLTTHMSQNREGWRTDGSFGGKALLSDSLCVIAFHWGVSTEIYILQGEIKPGNSTLAFLTGTRWDPGQTFRAVAKLNRDAPYDQILLPNESKQQRVKLPHFCGHPLSLVQGGCHNAKITTAVPGGVQSADGGARPLLPDS